MRSGATGASTVTHKSSCKLKLKKKTNEFNSSETPLKHRGELKRMLSEGAHQVDETRNTLAVLDQNLQDQTMAGHPR